MSFTLCVPTKNRPAFVARLLRYYARQRFAGAILIGDSSDPARAEQTRRVVEAAAASLSVAYVACPAMNVMECLEHVGALAQTAYAAWVSDDDFLCTGGIAQGMAFLDAHSDYAAAQGRGLLFEVDAKGPHGRMITLRPYPRASLEHDRAAARLRAHLDADLPSLHTAVRRLEAFREMVGGFGRMPGARQGFIFDDIIPHCLAAMQGKVKALEGLYIVRHAHEGIYRQMPAYDWITDPDWQPSYQMFHRLVTAKLVEQDGLSPDAAAGVLKEAFWPFLAKSFSSSWRKTHPPASALAEPRWRRIAKQAPGVRWAWRAAQSAWRQRRDPWSLPALLNSSSSYANEFRPIYEVVRDDEASSGHGSCRLAVARDRAAIEATMGMSHTKTCAMLPASPVAMRK